MTSNWYFGTFDQHYNLSHGRKDSTQTREIIMKEINMLALNAKSYLEEHRRLEVVVLMKKYSNTLTDLIGKDDLKSALEKIDNFQNIFADLTSKKLVKKLTKISKKEKCSAEQKFLKFQIKSSIGHVEERMLENQGVCLCKYWNRMFKECH